MVGNDNEPANHGWQVANIQQGQLSAHQWTKSHVRNATCWSLLKSRGSPLKVSTTSESRVLSLSDGYEKSLGLPQLKQRGYGMTLSRFAFLKVF